MDFLIAGAKALLHIELTPAQVALFQKYADELQAWNAQFNLTAIKDPKDVQVKHFLDSLSLLKVIARPAEGLRLVDVGTGAGFPGIPLKILCPELNVTLVEATGKKVAFCEHIIKTLNLSGIRVVKARAEEVGRDPEHRERYDWAVARAVAEMSILAEYLLPLVKRGGHVIAQKGEDAPAETHHAQVAVNRLGGDLQKLIPVELPGVVETRYLVLFNKVAATPPKYPRAPGLPAKKPIK